MLRNTSNNKSNIYERDWWIFYRQNFIIDYFSVDWDGLLKIDELNGNNSIQIYLNKIKMLLNTSALLKRLTIAS